MDKQFITTFALLLIALLGHGVSLAGSGWQAADLPPVRRAKEQPKHEPVPIIVEGKPAATLVVLPSAGDVRTVVKELQEVVEEMTGATMPTAKEIPANGPAIVIGECEAARAAGLTPEKLEPEGYGIKTMADRIYIVGRRDDKQRASWAYNGNRHGLAAFMERCLGVRWYFPQKVGGRFVPKVKALYADPVWIEDAPVYRKRTFWPPWDHVPAKNMRYTHLVGLIGGGNSWPYGVQCHTPHWQRNKDYVQNRPEVFALRADGTRNFAILCYGNPHTLETYLEEIGAILSGRVTDRSARRRMVTIHGKAISVSPADLGITCKCEDCRRLMEPEKGQYASASRLIGTFVARLAERVKKRWPDMLVTYLPYMNYTLAPEGVEFPDNVQVMLCGMPGVAMYKEPALLRAFQANIDRWHKLTGRQVETWDYCCWPADRTKAPYQYPHVVRDYLRHNRGTIVGMFINGTNGDWVRQHVTLYCWLKLLWNPETNVDAVMDEYCKRMYGPAAGTVRELLRLQCERWEDVKWPRPRISIKSVYGKSFPPEVVTEMKALLERAYREAGDNAVVKQRLDYYAYPFEAFFKEATAVHEGKGLRKLVAKKVGDNPIIDGKLDDAVWDAAEPAKMERPKGAEPKYPTEIRAVWTLDGLSLAFKMGEPDPEQLHCPIKVRDDALAWHNDNVEIFLDVTGKNEGTYYHWIINPNPTIYDAYNGGTQRHGSTSWNPEGVKIATARGKDFWTLEIYMPYSIFENMKRPGTGVEWVGQFTRHRIASAHGKRSKDNPREYTRMNFQFGGPSNNTADFSAIQFVE